MSWIEIILIGCFLVAIVAIVRHRGRSGGGSCCSNEGMDDDGYDINGLGNRESTRSKDESS